MSLQKVRITEEVSVENETGDSKEVVEEVQAETKESTGESNADVQETPIIEEITDETNTTDETGVDGSVETTTTSQKQED